MIRGFTVERARGGLQFIAGSIVTAIWRPASDVQGESLATRFFSHAGRSVLSTFRFVSGNSADQSEDRVKLAPESRSSRPGDKNCPSRGARLEQNGGHRPRNQSPKTGTSEKTEEKEGTCCNVTSVLILLIKTNNRTRFLRLRGREGLNGTRSTLVSGCSRAINWVESPALWEQEIRGLRCSLESGGVT